MLCYNAMKEKQIQNTILEYLNKCGFLAFPVQTQGQYRVDRQKWVKRANKHELRGVADITCWLGNGKTLFIEVKTEKTKNQLRESQKEFRTLALKFGHLYMIAFNLEMVIEFLKTLKEEI